MAERDRLIEDWLVVRSQQLGKAVPYGRHQPQDRARVGAVVHVRGLVTVSRALDAPTASKQWSSFKRRWPLAEGSAGFTPRGRHRRRENGVRTGQVRVGHNQQDLPLFKMPDS